MGGLLAEIGSLAVDGLGDEGTYIRRGMFLKCWFGGGRRAVVMRAKAGRSSVGSGRVSMWVGSSIEIATRLQPCPGLD